MHGTAIQRIIDSLPASDLKAQRCIVISCAVDLIDIRRVSKNVPPLACHNVGRNVTDEVSYQKTLCHQN